MSGELMTRNEMRELLKGVARGHRLVFNYWGEPVGCDCSLHEGMSEADHLEHFSDVLMAAFGYQQEHAVVPTTKEQQP